MKLIFATLFLLAAVIAPSQAFATDLSNVLVDYTLTTWGEKDGLPSSVVWAIAQDREGYLWLGTDAGPVRFDGARFIPWEPLGPTLLPKFPVRALCASRDGGVWFGLADSGGISRLRNGQLRNYGVRDGLVEGTVAVLFEEPDGTMWAGTSAGLFRLAGDRWEHERRGLPAGPVHTIYRTRAGQFLVGTDAGVFRRGSGSDDTAFHSVGVADIVRGIAEDRSGAIWVTDQFVSFRKLDERRTATSYREQGRGNRLIVDTVGNLWVGAARQGLWRVRQDAASPVPIVEKSTALVGFSDDGVTALLQDAEGNIWAGTLDGLNRLTPHRITPVTDLGLVSGVEVTSDGTVWVGGVDSLIRFEDGSLRRRRPAEPLPGVVAAMHADRDGALWVAAGGALLRFRGATRSAIDIGLGGTLRATAITTDSHRNVWISDSERGLMRWDGSALTTIALPRALADSRLVAVHVDRADRVWFAFANGLAGTLGRDGIVHAYGRDDGLHAGGARLIYEDGAGAIWIAGTEGLSRFGDGRFVTLKAMDGFPTESLTGMLEDAAGFFWLGGEGAGIVRVSRGEIEQALADQRHQLRYRVFDKFDGFAGTPRWFGNRAAVRTVDGQLWFLAGRGATVIDPAALPHDPPSPVRVRIEGVVADERRIPVLGGALLPARTSRLQIDYAVLDLTSSRRTHFRYRLDGFDQDWIDAGSRRQAFYTNLPPREYRFRAMASNDDGTWSEAAGTWAFAIAPAFYQTNWFLAACVLAVAVTIGGAWRLHVRRVRNQFSLLIGERARLSREIHDTLLQGLYGVALRCEAITKAVEANAPWLQQHFLQMRRDVQEYIHEARQSIQDLRSPRLHGCDLPHAVRDFGERVTRATPVSFALEVHGIPREMPNVDQQLLRIAQEAIVNALRHADASAVRVDLTYDDGGVTLRVADDGRGFDPQVSARTYGHYGLTGMKERAESVGGTFTITSNGASGALVVATLPARRRAWEPAVAR